MTLNIFTDNGYDFVSATALDDEIIIAQPTTVLSGLQSSPFPDVINDFLLGEQDYDRISGKDGDDVISGLDGDDRISGLDGDDWISGDQGFDTLIGGAGADLFFVGSSEAGQDVITDFKLGVDRLIFPDGLTEMDVQTRNSEGNTEIIRNGEVIATLLGVELPPILAIAIPLPTQEPDRTKS
jgi:Ca2+-binding RTX toxin-like protein